MNPPATFPFDWQPNRSAVSGRFGLESRRRTRGRWSILPVVPVAHNAGLVWPRNAFIKRPGLVTVRVGPPIETANRKPEAINAEAEAWIEAQQIELCPTRAN